MDEIDRLRSLDRPGEAPPRVDVADRVLADIRDRPPARLDPLLALMAALGSSAALTACAFQLPFFTFYAITGFLLGDTMGPWLAVSWAYGFTVVAMLIPAVSEFDVALGRTTLDKG